MSQNDFNIANQGFPSFRSDLNDALQALASNSSGATEPATTYAGQFWYDSTNDVLKFRNEANSAWIDPPIAGLVQALSDLGVTASAAELNKMDGVTATTAELNYVDGVTSNIQTQLNAKGDISGVTAGSGISGGGTSGTVTVSHADTSSQGSVNNGGTTFIQDITLDTYGHITGLTSAAAAAGAEILGSWDASSTPQSNFTSNGTWSKPSGYSDSQWVIFYLVAGGQAGGKQYQTVGGRGGNATVVAGTYGDLPSSVAIVVGTGGTGVDTQVANPNGGALGSETTITANGLTVKAYPWAASDGDQDPTVIFPDVGNPFVAPLPNVANTMSNFTPRVGLAGFSSTYGAGSGGSCTGAGVNGAGGTSTYAGNGGAGQTGSDAGDGVAPGGGGGSCYLSFSGTAGDGAAGSVRVYII